MPKTNSKKYDSDESSTQSNASNASKASKMSKSSNNYCEEYCYPSDKKFTCSKELRNEPHGSEWIHDDFSDDDVSSKDLKRMTKIYKKLAALEFPAQKSIEWLKLRSDRATASDSGCIMGYNHYEYPFKFLLKKMDRTPFLTNKFCYHGNKYEQIATMIYEYRMNVSVTEFGLIGHPDIDFLAASPDGIVSQYKLDGIHKTKHVGRMLEIKCPVSRTIKRSGEVRGDICPEYYWAQVQQQLECCDLNVCDFWQCSIEEYPNRDEFVEDTLASEPFRSKSHKLEKGVVIQLLPLARLLEAKTSTYEQYLEITYKDATFIHQPKIEMSPYDCDIWIRKTIENLYNIKDKDGKFIYTDRYVDKVKYWKLIESHCCEIERDKKWFEEEALPKIGKMWSYVEFLRKNKDKEELLYNWIVANKWVDTKSEKNNDKIIETVEKLMNVPDKKDKKELLKYEQLIADLKDTTTKLTDKINETKKIFNSKKENSCDKDEPKAVSMFGQYVKKNNVNK